MVAGNMPCTAQGMSAPFRANCAPPAAARWGSCAHRTRNEAFSLAPIGTTRPRCQHEACCCPATGSSSARIKPSCAAESSFSQLVKNSSLHGKTRRPFTASNTAQYSVLPYVMNAGFSLLIAGATALQLVLSQPASAVLNLPRASTPRTVEAALRRSIPAFNPEVAKMQKTTEDIAFLLRIPQRKPWGSMASDVASLLEQMQHRDTLSNGVPAAQKQKADAQLERLYSHLKQLELAVKTQQPDLISVRASDVLNDVSDLELLQAPGLSFAVPSEFAAAPRLVGRALVDFTVEKRDGALAFVDPAKGGLLPQGHIRITLDGFSAPLSAGNFAANVQRGLYNDRPVQASYSSVIVSAPLRAEGQAAATVPLEILPTGGFDPIYKSALDVQNGELPVLPLSIAGAVSMTHLPDSDEYLSGEEWFIYKFDKQQAGLAGLSFDEGTFGVFGYVTQGMDVVQALEPGDVVVRAEVVQGGDKLQQATQQAG